MHGAKADRHRDAVLRLEKLRQRAMLGGDVTLLRDLFADDAVYMHSSGSLHNKDEYLRALRAGEFIYRSIEILDCQCRVMDDAVLITGQSRHDVLFRSGPRMLEARFLSVWVVDRGIWRHVSWQSTPIQQLRATNARA
ncbi:nuclear transport factor 2 family protein [Burkholderia pseudomultivorans]|uniref:SnoaL-like domain protein n=2 Tax=Burkholderia cepacia complex TaxID=87882 RepID=A0AAN0RYG8_9BURK|nr:nuclear transport factor 2 family protein [Burkholderia pseudomultivorans]AIO36392.1 snoaL-like domain protein [Burkholderia cenocepacia]KWF64564.1 hypothetical protein WT57_20845 [Burkholderia pseudomultivorans]